MDQSHVISLVEASQYDCTAQWASAGTLRDTRKRLKYRVTFAPSAVSFIVTDNQEVIYQGESLVEAVARYNELR
jgi:hypothetical protein